MNEQLSYDVWLFQCERISKKARLSAGLAKDVYEEQLQDLIDQYPQYLEMAMEEAA